MKWIYLVRLKQIYCRFYYMFQKTSQEEGGWICILGNINIFIFTNIMSKLFEPEANMFFRL